MIHKNGPIALKKLINDSQLNSIFQPYLGLELIQHPDLESEISLSSKITSQRKFYKPNKNYAKPVLSSISCTWGLGFHYSLDFEKIIINTDLILIHLAYISPQETLRRNLYWANSPKSFGDNLHVNQEGRPTTFNEVCDYYRRLLNGDFINAHSWTKDQF